MRNLLLSLAILFLGSTLSAQDSPIFDFISSIKIDNERMTSVFIGPSMAEMMLQGASEEEKGEMQELFKDFKGMRILAVEENPQPIFERFQKEVSLKDYVDILSVQDGGEYVRIVGKSNGETYTEIAMIVSEESELVIMSFMGILKKEDLGKLSKTFNMNMEGMNMIKQDGEKQEKEE